MHDLFDVLGLPSNAPIGEIRRVCAQRVRRLHPDFRLTAQIPGGGEGQPPPHALPHDIAVDFVDVASLVDRIETSFFRDPS